MVTFTDTHMVTFTHSHTHGHIHIVPYSHIRTLSHSHIHTYGNIHTDSMYHLYLNTTVCTSRASLRLHWVNIARESTLNDTVEVLEKTVVALHNVYFHLPISTRSSFPFWFIDQFPFIILSVNDNRHGKWHHLHHHDFFWNKYIVHIDTSSHTSHRIYPTREVWPARFRYTLDQPDQWMVYLNNHWLFLFTPTDLIIIRFKCWITHW